MNDSMRNFLIWFVGVVVSEGYVFWWAYYKDIDFCQTNEMNRRDLYWIFSTMTSLFSWVGLFAIVTLTTASATGKYLREANSKKLILHRRVARLLRLHFGDVINAIFTLAVVVLVAIIFMELR